MRPLATPGRRLRAAALGAGLIVATAGTSIAAAALTPRDDTPRGATVTVTPSTVSASGTVAFTGTGFSGAKGAGDEAVCVKVDDGNVSMTTGTGDLEKDVFVRVYSAADGTVSGTVDLSRVDPAFALAPGTHWLRFLSGPTTCDRNVKDDPRSLHANFTVSAPPATPTPTPAPVGGGSGGGTTGGGATPSPTPIPVPERVVGGTVVVTQTVLKLDRLGRLAIPLKAGGKGSAGTIRVRSKDKVKLGKGPRKRQVLLKSDSYLVDPGTSETIKLRPTAEGKTLLKKKKSMAAVVEIRDASGEGDVDQPVVIRR